MMKKFSKIILMIMVFLFMSQVITSGLAWQKKGSNVGMFNPMEDWTEESEEDEVRNEAIDLSTLIFPSRLATPAAGITNSRVESLNTKDHIQEVIPPPPKS